MGETTDSRNAQLEKWAQAYREWQCGEDSQREYCDRKGIRFWQFKAGVENSRRAGILERVKRNRITGFAPVQLIEQTSNNTAGTATPYCDMRFNGQAGIRIESVESRRDFMGLMGCGSQR